MALDLLTAGAGVLGNILGRGGSQKQSTTSSVDMTERYNRGTVDAGALLEQLLGSGMGQPVSMEDIQATSLQRAQSDTEGVVESIFENYRNEYLPEVFTASESAGVFGASGGQQLAERGFADATARASEVTLGTANTYANQLQQESAQIQQFLSQLFALDIEQTGRSNRRGTEKGTSTGSSQNPLDFSGITGSLIASIGANQPGTRE